MGSKLLETVVSLYENTSVLDGSGGGDISVWEDEDGFRPNKAVFLITNTGDSVLKIGSHENGPLVVLVDGIVAGFLFEGREVILQPGDSVYAHAPENISLFGNVWSLSGDLVSDSVPSVSVSALAMYSVNKFIFSY